MIEILRAIEAVYNSIRDKEAETTRILNSAKAREDAVIAREARCTGIESAQVVLKSAQEQRARAEALAAEVKEDRVKLENDTRKEMQKIADENTRLAPLQDKEKQLFKEKQALYEAQQALEVEKSAWKLRYIAEIKAYFAQSGGKAPDPNSIQ